MKSVYILILQVCTMTLSAQSIAGFENFDLPLESFLNGSDNDGGFSSGKVFLPNTYTAEYDSWSGWAISNTTDVTTPGYFNQYSAITGSGVGGSANYAVSFVVGESKLILQNEAAGKRLEGFYVTNSTYAYLSMLEGDAFAKRFGGVTADDPDFFLLTIRKYHNGELSPDSLDFYLADFRFEDNSEDYIIDEWTYIDLIELGSADSLLFELSSSDVGQFGMNTPAYFCVDNIITTDGVSTSLVSNTAEDKFKIYPNPASDFINVNNPLNQETTCLIHDTNGRLMYRERISRKNNSVDIQALVRGVYIVQIVVGDRRVTRWLIKE